MWKHEGTGLVIKKAGCVTAEIMWSDAEEEWILYAKPGNTSDLEKLGPLEGLKKEDLKRVEESADEVIQDYIDDLISEWKETKEKWKHSTNH